MPPMGCNSTAEFVLPNSRSHSSRTVSLEKSASTAPALVPVAMSGFAALGDQAKAAVRGISRKRTILGIFRRLRTWMFGV